MANVYFWLGDATDTTAVVVARSDTAGTLTVTGATASPVAVDPTSDYGIAKLTLTGLTADAQTAVTVLLDGVAVCTPTVRTLPATPEWKFAWGSCVGQHKAASFGYQMVMDHDVRLFFAIGDTPYTDETTTAVTVNGTSQMRWQKGATIPGTYSDYPNGRVAWDKGYAYLQQTPGWAYLTELVPTYRLPDDHEYGDDWDWLYNNAKNAGNFSPALADQATADTLGHNANLAAWSWNIGNPDPDAGVDGWKPSSCLDSVSNHPPKFYRKQVGNVEFFHLDCYGHMDSWAKAEKAKTVCVDRAENSTLGYSYSDPSGAALGKTMLGPHQLNWLLDRLAASTATFKVICSGKFTSGMNMVNLATSTNHGWDVFTTERDYIQAFIKEYVTGVLWLCGDAHIPSVINDIAKDHAAVNSSPLGQIEYIGSSGTRFYNPGYSDCCIYRAEGWTGDTSPGVKTNAYGIVEVTEEYLRPQLWRDNGELLWEGYLLAGRNTLLPSPTHPTIQLL